MSERIPEGARRLEGGLIRTCHPSDLPALYRICLLTGDNGRDASPIYRDPDLLGHFYAGPYAVFEPELCFVLTCGGNPCGYILGTADTAAFSLRCEADWFPVLRRRYPPPSDADASPDAEIVRMIHAGRMGEPPGSAYPAHLHIDLLPEAQGQGWGRRLMDIFCNRLRELGVPGVYLGVSMENPDAIGFYRRMGFQTLVEAPSHIIFAMRL